MRHRRLIPAWATLLAACSPAERQPTVVVRDSAGISIVESREPGWGAGTEWRIGEPSVRFESAEVATAFGAVRLDNGTTVLGDESGSRLLFFGSDGALRREVGRRGDGPGEFRVPQFLGRIGDTVWVYDYAQASVTRFTSDGDLIDVIRLTPPMPTAIAVGRLPDGSHILMSQWHTGGARQAQGLMRDTVAVVRYRDGLLTDTLGMVEGREFVQRADETGRMVMTAAIHARRASATTWSDAIVIGDQSDHSLRVVDKGGRERKSIRWLGPDLTVTSADVAAWVDAQTAAAPQVDRDRLRTMYASLPLPRRRPAYTRLLSDASGHLWVAEYPRAANEPTRWDVFAPDGVWLGTVHVPENFRLLDIGEDWVLGVRPDSVDFERLELRPLRSER